MDMQHEHVARTRRMDTQHENVARTCSVDMDILSVVGIAIVLYVEMLKHFKKIKVKGAIFCILVDILSQFLKNCTIFAVNKKVTK
jgi:hypothetical protein